MVTPEMLAVAQERLEDGDRRKPNTLRNVGTPAERARGFAAEETFGAWLRRRGLEHIQHGGPDWLPDIELGSRAIGVKFCGSHVPFRPSHFVYAFKRHLAGITDWAFIGGVSGENDLLLLGFASAEQLANGLYVARGQELCRGFIAADDLYALRVDDLESPSVWLRRSQAS